MKNLSKLKKEYEDKLSNIFYNKNIEHCSPSESQTIRLAAEIKAYHDYILPNYPENFSKYSISDFNGIVSDREKVLPTKKALAAKMKIAEFCWGITDPNELKHILSQDNYTTILMKRNKLDERLTKNQNVIIYSQSDNNITTDEDNNIHVEINRKPKGRTLAASIIMKEAINLRSCKGHLSHDYKWVSFSSLKKYLLHRESDYDAQDKIRSKIRSYQMCEWLVVDDIIEEDMSDRAASYTSAYLDSFFQERLENNSCTILICKFNIDNNVNLEQYFGLTLSKMINSDKTFKICL